MYLCNYKRKSQNTILDVQHFRISALTNFSAKIRPFGCCTRKNVIYTHILKYANCTVENVIFCETVPSLSFLSFSTSYKLSYFSTLVLQLTYFNMIYICWFFEIYFRWTSGTSGCNCTSLEVRLVDKLLCDSFFSFFYVNAQIILDALHIGRKCLVV